MTTPKDSPAERGPDSNAPNAAAPQAPPNPGEGFTRRACCHAVMDWHALGRWGLAGAAIVAVYAAVTVPRLGQITGQDELHWLWAGWSLHAAGVARDFAQPSEAAPWSPHLYAETIRLAFCVFGRSVWAARIPGLIAWALTAVVVMVAVATSTRAWRRGPPLVAVAAGLGCATMPLAAQAAAVIDIDNSLMPLAVVLLCMAVRALCRTGGWRGRLALALSMALGLWCRPTTPVVLAPLFIVLAAVSRGRRPRAWVDVAGSLVAGSGLFLLTWWLYCRAYAIPFSGPFLYTWNALEVCLTGSRGADASRLVQNVIYLWLWTALWALPAAGLGAAVWAAHRVRARAVEAGDVFMLAGLFLLAGYTVVGGSIFGFPKYQCPALPLLCIAVARALVGARESARAGAGRATAAPVPGDSGGRAGMTWHRVWLHPAAALGVGAVIPLAVTGDVLYRLRCDYRAAVAFGLTPPGGILRDVAIRLLLGAVLGAVICAALSLRRGHRCWVDLRVVAAMALGISVGVQVQQLTAPYQTGYNYGDAGDAVAAAQTIRSAIPSGTRAVVPGEVTWLIGLDHGSFVPNALWTDGPGLTAVAADPATAAVAVSLLTNAVAQVQFVFRHEPLQAVLQQHYCPHPVGAYALWIKHEHGNGHGDGNGEGHEHGQPENR